MTRQARTPKGERRFAKSGVSTRDLFGEIIVTHDDVKTWLDAVPNLSAAPWRRETYRRHWNVADKIREAKRRDDFDGTPRT